MLRVSCGHFFCRGGGGGIVRGLACVKILAIGAGAYCGVGDYWRLAAYSNKYGKLKLGGGGATSCRVN